jgi:POT family proton-dependent oligopeptide transporter
VVGQQRAVFYGGVVIMCGHISLAMEGIPFFLLGLFLVIVGTGLLKPNISTIVGQLYDEEDRRRDAGFSIYYMGINLGAAISPFVCGWLAQSAGFRSMLEGWGLDPARSWHWGFGAAAVGMFLGLVQYRLGRPKLRGAGAEPNDPLSDGQRRGAILALLAIIAIGALILLTAGTSALGAVPTVNKSVAFILLVTPVAFFAWLLTAGSRDRDERKRHLVILVLFLGASVFWAAFEQAGSTLNLFAQRSTRTSILGFEFPASWFQSANAAFIILLAPVFAWLWIRLGKREPSSPGKFTFGLLFVSLGFALLIPAARMADAGAQVSPLWLIGTYLLHTIGELSLSPVGLSAMTRLAPMRYAGLMLGVWFLASSVGNFIGGNVSGFYETFTTDQIFMAVAGFTLVMCIVLALFVKPIKRMLARA